MINDSYITPIQTDLNYVEREEHVYTDLFTMSMSYCRSGVAENRPGAGGEGDNVNSTIGKHRSNRNRSKIIIAVLVVVAMIAVAVAIVVAITADWMGESNNNPDKCNNPGEPSGTQLVKGSTTARRTSLSTSSLQTITSITSMTTHSTTETTTISTQTMNITPTTTTTTKQTTIMTTPSTIASSTTTSLPQSPEPQTIEQQCENGATLIPHRECQLYYNCSLRYGFLMYNPFEEHMQECPYPTQFDTKTMKCEDFERVDCGKRRDTKDGCQYRANRCTRSHCIPCVFRYPSCLEKPDGANVDDNRPWTHFYVTCYMERFLTKEECPSDVNGHTQFFHPDIRECIPLDFVPQEHGGTMPKCEGRENGANIDDLRLWSPYYAICYKERFVTRGHCPGDIDGHTQIFHPDKRKCVPLDMVPQEHHGTMPKCEGREDGNYLDDVGRCNQFTVCESGAIAEIIKCKGGEVYDTLQEECVEIAKACEPCGEKNIC